MEHPFDRRIWRKAQLLVVGAILHPGKRAAAPALSIPGAIGRATSPSEAIRNGNINATGHYDDVAILSTDGNVKNQNYVGVID